VLGSPGGGRIINTVLQVVIDVIDHGLTVDASVRAPRIHHQWRPDHIHFEQDSLDAEARAGLAAIGHTFAEHPTVIGRCQAIGVAEDGSRIAAADPRSGGAAAIE
jgi:gamma-glutamyltranspeptidase/glutathione hydrolase